MACIGGLLGKSLWTRIEVGPTKAEPATEFGNQK